MGLLKKLAGLVVEFPDDAEAPSGYPAGEGEDVVSAIEQIRMDLEKSTQIDFGAGTQDDSPAAAAPRVTTSGGEDIPAPPAAQPGAQPADGISVPRLLTIQEVYDRAGLKPEGEFDIFKVERMLADPEIADLELEMRARMVRLTLKNMGRDLTDILADAGLRDQAMEQYQDYLERRVAETEVQVARANDELQRAIDEFVTAHKERIEQNQQKLAAARATLDGFVSTKQAEEQRLFEVAAPFVGDGHNPVKLD